MAVNFKMDVYGLTAMGKKILIGHANDTVQNAFPTGGKIFYIDPDDNGATYHFFDQHGEEIQVGIGDSPYAYTVTGTPAKDKYYVFYPSAYTSKRWTYYQNGAYVYNSLGTQDGIGKGRANTALVMAADDGAYITNDSNGVATIWYSLQQMNANKIGGCEDWFVPSKAEVEKIRTAVDGEGNPITTLFSNTYIWSSSEDSAQYAWYWRYNSQVWDGSDKLSSRALVGVRAF